MKTTQATPTHNAALMGYMGKKYNHAAMRTPDPDNYAEFLAYYMAMPRDRKLMIYGQVILANEFARDGTIAAQPAAQ